MNPAKAAFNKWWKDNSIHENATDSFKAFQAGWEAAFELATLLQNVKKAVASKTELMESK